MIVINFCFDLGLFILERHTVLNLRKALIKPICRFTGRQGVQMIKQLKFRRNTKGRRGFTMIELLTVILIVSILAAVSMAIMRGRIESAKWSEANAMAGTVRRAVYAYTTDNGVDATRARFLGENLSVATIRLALGFDAMDLSGKYFVPGDFTVTAIDSRGTAEITVTGSRPGAPQGIKILRIDGSWQ
jgi:prepilin-type N-terminal cleavage/methylation domain-containing protein